MLILMLFLPGQEREVITMFQRIRKTMLPRLSPSYDGCQGCDPDVVVPWTCPMPSRQDSKTRSEYAEDHIEAAMKQEPQLKTYTIPMTSEGTARYRHTLEAEQARLTHARCGYLAGAADRIYPLYKSLQMIVS